MESAFFSLLLPKTVKNIIMNEPLSNSGTHGADNDKLLACTAQWTQTSIGVRFAHLVDYHSYNAYGTYNLEPEEWDNREMIYNFKNNSELTDPISHKNAMDKAISLLLPFLRKTFGELLPEITLVCVPASTAEKTAARFEEFAQIVTGETGMVNGYQQVHVVVDSESKHLSDTHLPQYSLNEEFFAGRPVLLFDDIMATGGSINKFAAHMTETGAVVLGAVVLGKTVTKPSNE